MAASIYSQNKEAKIAYIYSSFEKITSMKYTICKTSFSSIVNEMNVAVNQLQIPFIQFQIKNFLSQLRYVITLRDNYLNNLTYFLTYEKHEYLEYLHAIDSLKNILKSIFSYSDENILHFFIIGVDILKNSCTKIIL